MSNLIPNFHNFTRQRNNVIPVDADLLYTASGMVFEAGEAGDVIKKHCRGSKVDLRDFVLECGDSLYYMSQTLDKIGYSLYDAIVWNQKKLELRDMYGKEKGNELLMEWLNSK